MKKLFVILFPIMVLAQNVEDIVKNIDVKKEIEDFIQVFEIIPGAFKSYNYMQVYRTSICLREAIRPYFYEYLEKNIEIKSDSEFKWYEEIIYENLVSSTHILLGEVVKKEVNVGDYCGEETLGPYPSRLWIRIIQGFKGTFKKDIFPLWVETGEEQGIISSVPIYNNAFVGDTVLLFLRDLPLCKGYAEKYGDDINYTPGDFFSPTACSVHPVMTLNGEKRVRGCPGTPMNLPYKDVIKVLDFFIEVCNRLEKEAKKYKVPLTKEEYKEFMKSKGYNWPFLTPEGMQKINKKYEKYEEIKKRRSR